MPNNHQDALHTQKYYKKKKFHKKYYTHKNITKKKYYNNKCKPPRATGKAATTR